MTWSRSQMSLRWHRLPAPFSLPAAALSLAACAALAAGPASAKLPDGRAYEMVSPPEKFSTHTLYTGPGFFASEDGDRVVFAADAAGAFGGAVNSIYNQFVAERGAGGWSSHAVSLPSELQAQGQAITSAFIDFACTTCTDVIGQSFESIDPRDDDYDPVFDTPSVADLFRSGGAGNYEWLSQGPIGGTAVSVAAYGGRTLDGSRVAFDIAEALVPEASGVLPGRRIAYLRSGDSLSVAGVDDDGDVLDGGSVIGGGPAASAHNAISENGETVFFQSPDPGSSPAPSTLYARLGGTNTVRVSAPDCSVPTCDGTGEQVIFHGASSDGRLAYFATLERLTDDDVNDMTDIYVRDLVGGQLERVTAGEDGTGSGGIAPPESVMLGVSDDGRTVYFSSSAILTTEPNANGDTAQVYDGSTTAPNNYAYRWTPDGGSVKFVGNLNVVTLTGPEGERQVAMTPDGGTFVFRGQPFGESQTSVYRYGWDDEALICLSCGTVDGQRRGSSALHDSLLRGTVNPSRDYQRGLAFRRARNVSDDGQTVFFQTPDALIAEDVNGQVDVYRWHDGALALISAGTGEAPSWFVDASADGTSAFFATADRLVPSDGDGVFDIYAARVGGGFPEPVKEKCEGDACQGQRGGRPPWGVSSGGSAAGNGTSRERRRLSLMSLSRGAAARLASGRPVVVRLRVTSAGRVSVTGRARIGRRSTIVARATGVARRPGVLRLRLTLSRAARKALAQRTALRVTFAARASGVAGSEQRTLRLRRAAGTPGGRR